MGCGQSKINLYRRRSKNSGKRNGAKKSGAVGNEADEEEDSAAEPAPEEATEEPDNQQHVLPIAEHQPPFEVSASQQNFFKMLDEKIEQGKDYDSTSETEVEYEQERKRLLIEHWHAVTQSTQSSLQSSPPASSPRRLTRSVSRASEQQCAPSTSKQVHRQEFPPARRSHSAQTHDSASTEWDAIKSPLKRTQSAGANWKGGPKVAPFPKPKERRDEPVAGCSKDSQITTTYNPTFQSHSPAHKSQPYKAQIVSYPLSQQVAPPSPGKYIAPPEEYQDPQVADRQATVSQVYYIHGGATDLEQQRQQTAINLQQYVAMKQAQQQMFTSYAQAPRMLEGEELAAQYGYPGPRSHSAPTRLAHEVGHLGAPLWSPLPPVAGPWQVPPEMQYYPQSQFVSMYRAGAGSRLDVVRGKPVGQVVSLGGQDLAVSADSPSPASASTDSGVSPGTGPSSKSSCSTPPAAPDSVEPKPKKKTRALKISKSLDT